jgi:hypothetical protein
LLRCGIRDAGCAGPDPDLHGTSGRVRHLRGSGGRQLCPVSRRVPGQSVHLAPRWLQLGRRSARRASQHHDGRRLRHLSFRRRFHPRIPQSVQWRHGVGSDCLRRLPRPRRRSGGDAGRLRVSELDGRLRRWCGASPAPRRCRRGGLRRLPFRCGPGELHSGGRGCVAAVLLHAGRIIPTSRRIPAIPVVQGGLRGRRGSQ